MADQELWRKNIPEDFQGKMGENWDDEIPMKPVIWSAVALAGSVAFAFVLCWVLMFGPLDYLPQKYFGFTTELSPLEEANARRLPPQPWVQPKPEMEMDAWLEEMDEQTSSYGWTDELNGLVRIPVDRAIDMVAASLESAPATVEPTQEEPVDVEPETSGDASEGELSEDVGSGESSNPDADVQGEAHG